MEAIQKLVQEPLYKIVISNPKSGAVPFRKITLSRGEDGHFFIEKLTEKQAFHGTCTAASLSQSLTEFMALGFRQLDAWSKDRAYTLKISKKGKETLLQKKVSASAPKAQTAHNREKQYILKEYSDIPPLVDLGVFTKEGKIVRSRYDKYRQINRFTELIDDALKNWKKDTIRILDFGCGKSYLTFILYHYLVKIRGISAEILGLDLKEQVINDCNTLAEKYGYSGLSFRVGDVGDFSDTQRPDMMITLHACDTATDYALYHAVRLGCPLIFSVPCCQHELNQQIAPQTLTAFTAFGLVRERFSALSTDTLRGLLLRSRGYEVDMLEFVDMEHSPKNLMIRAVQKNISQQKRKEAQKQAEDLMEAFHFSPTLYKLLHL